MKNEKKSSRKPPHLEYFYSTQGFFLLIFSLLLALSLLSYHDRDSTKNWLGLLGHIMGWCANYLFGLASLLIPFFCGWFGWKMTRKQPIRHPRYKLCYFFLLLIATATLLAQLAYSHPWMASIFQRWIYSDYYPHGAFYDSERYCHYLGGVPFHHIYSETAVNLKNIFGGFGTFILSCLLCFSATILLIEMPISYLARIIKRLYRRSISFWHFQFKKPLKPARVNLQQTNKPVLIRDDPLKRETCIRLPEKSNNTSSHLPSLAKQEVSSKNYLLPPSSLLTEISPIDSSSLKNDLKRQAEILEETLLSFGIEAKVGDIHCGPTVASFEVHPAVGVKVQKIKTLENDIALNMEAKSIRIIAPIPGKAAVGIEIPSPKPQEVSFRELLENYQRSHKKAHIPLLLGKIVNGNDIWTDLTKMPHLIIAGATGSGKSVCINTIVMSLVMNAHPNEIKIVMIDPKKVELTAYTHLPHMLAPVITEPRGSAAALNWLVKEMERRYEIFRQLGIRNIHGFNTRKIHRQLEDSLDLDIPDQLPYIVVIIDELADLMMVSSSDIETPIARIAQMARAVGIHMILATQRPSREVITGLIKANFPCRIAFKVSSRINSQIIIDENGAESLLGNGDLLFLPPGTSNLLRAQGAFIRDEDINTIIHYICSQASTNYLIPSFETYQQSSIEEGDDVYQPTPLYEEAKALIFETGNASTTFLQRKLKIGYARAAGLMDELQAKGVIGPSEGAKPRKIYYPKQEA
ncbi:MAG: DNA translocase FtsK 4TM domain-containing protein [Chlamydiales bacterium]